jgi:putative ABC transport system ATP-binding protein
MLRGVGKDYPMPSGPFSALRGIDLDLARGELVAVVGPSGCGKTTLLHLVAGIDRPSSGTVVVAGSDLSHLDEDRMAAWRGRTVGVVFQFFQLLPTLTVAENVMLPMDFCATRRPAAARTRALALLERVGIAEQADKLPAALSGGQQQRAAIARAMANDPPLVVADEPTGNLDSAAGAMVLALLAQLAHLGTAVLLVTHDRELAAGAGRVVTMADGAICGGGR